MKRMTNRFVIPLLTLLLLAGRVSAADYLIPVGRVIGLELSQGSVTVAAFDDTLPAAKKAGLQIGDEIRAVDGKDIDCAEDLRKALTCSDGSVDLTVCRSGREQTISLEPEITSEGPRLGVYLRQGITGIGTVTYYDPDTGAFGTLGHGVNDAKGNLLTMSRGLAYPATVVSVQKGKAGTPGQLKGALSADRLLGTLSGNTGKGVFGTASDIWEGPLMPVAAFDEIRTGEAAIRSTVDGGEPRDYSVEILKIYPQNRADGRNLLLKVTDPELLTATGGIVQGMSGSPIIQDGKLVGAVTHVLVNDPTTGYGIFIENMLDAAS
ncbi:MAG: PDZ domain-containing protein [Oscillospiraceae bacterium]|nr:PDZ domain-containing protein [Oscillospiraceae bacterium]